MLTKKYLDELTYDIIGCAIEVHKRIGSGLLEGVYHECMIEELKHRKINFHTEKRVPIVYRNKTLDKDFRCDLFVENAIVVELKSVVEMNPIFEAQILTYMKLLKCPKGILINFNCKNIFNDGQKNFVNEYFTNLPNY